MSQHVEASGKELAVAGDAGRVAGLELARHIAAAAKHFYGGAHPAGIETQHACLYTHPQIVLTVLNDKVYLLVLYLRNVADKGLKTLCTRLIASQPGAVVDYPYLAAAIAEHG